MFIIISPLEQFEVVPLISLIFPIIGSTVLSLTNLGFYTIVVLTLITGLHVIANNSQRLVPSNWSIAVESAYASIQSTVRSQVGSANEIFTPLIYGIFWFVFIGNLCGNVPYGYTITTSAVVTIGLSVIVFLSVTIMGLNLHGFRFFSYFVPSGCPLALVPLLVLIEFVSYLARAVSLGVRLFSNIVAGHTLLKILSTFLAQLFISGIITAILTLIPFAIFVCLIGLEIAVSLIQSYVFVVLVCSYIKDAIELH